MKLLLNMLLLGMAGIPRGGLVTVSVDGRLFKVSAKGERAKVPQAMADVLLGVTPLDSIDARLVQPYYTASSPSRRALRSAWPWTARIPSL